MQGSKQQRRQDLSQFDSMTTDELRGLLLNDAFKKEADASLDIDATLYIAGVIASRENAPDTDAAWEEFERSYLPDAGEKTLYEEILSDPSEPINASSVRPRAKHRLLRFSLIAAAAALLISATAFTAAKIGWFHTWNTEELWSRQAREAAPAQATALPKPAYYDEMAEALDSIGAPAHMIPLWIPEEYDLVRQEVLNAPTSTSLIIIFRDTKSNEITFSYSSYATNDTSIFSKDVGSPDIYTTGGMDHSILTNMDSYGAVWWDRDCECFIYGYENRDDLIKTIDSLYMEVQNE